MNIKICDYEVINFDNCTLVMSEKGLSTITSPIILQVLEEIRPYVNQNITAKKLENILESKPLDTGEAIAFLHRCLNIVECPVSAPYEKIIFICDSEIESSIIDVTRSETKLATTTVAANKLDLEMIKGSRCFVVILQSHYNYHSLKTLYFNIAKAAPKSAVIVGYYTPDHYCVTQPYSFETGNPCHFCQADRLINYETKNSSKNNWAHLLKFSSEHDYRIPSRTHTTLQKALAVNLLINRIKLFTTNSNAKRHQDLVLALTYINLLTGKIDEEIVSHWVLCQCQRSF